VQPALRFWLAIYFSADRNSAANPDMAGMSSCTTVQTGTTAISQESFQAI